MDNDSIRDILLRLETPSVEVLVVQSGKESARMNGLYKPLDRTIILHNRNEAMKERAVLLRTAIHQYAHHLLVYGTAADPVPLPDPKEEISRHHGSRFSACYHRLLSRAGSLDIGVKGFPWSQDPPLSALTDLLKGTLLPRYGALALELGERYGDAEKRCAERGFSFDEWLEEGVGVEVPEARRMMRAHREGLSPASGYDAMKTLLKIPKEHRQEAVKAVESGDSTPKAVEAAYRPPFREAAEADSPRTDAEAEKLRREKRRLETKIEQMRLRISRLEARLNSMGADDE